MESNREEICKSLKQWFAVFYRENCISDDRNERYLNDLSDGVAVALSLRKLAPDYFTGERSTMKNVRFLHFGKISCISSQNHGFQKLRSKLAPTGD